MSVAEITKLANFEGGGGGAGSSLSWEGNVGSRPQLGLENSTPVYVFPQGTENELYAYLKIPQSKKTDKQMFLRLGAYSIETANSFLISVETTLIKKDVDPLTATTHQHLSTNTPLANVSPSGALREIIIDLTSTDGLINGQQVAAGDTLKFRLFRGVDSDVTEIRFIPSNTEVII